MKAKEKITNISRDKKNKIITRLNKKSTQRKEYNYHNLRFLPLSIIALYFLIIEIISRFSLISSKSVYLGAILTLTLSALISYIIYKVKPAKKSVINRLLEWHNKSLKIVLSAKLQAKHFMVALLDIIMVVSVYIGFFIYNKIIEHFARGFNIKNITEIYANDPSKIQSLTNISIISFLLIGAGILIIYIIIKTLVWNVITNKKEFWARIKVNIVWCLIFFAILLITLISFRTVPAALLFIVFVLMALLYNIWLQMFINGKNSIFKTFKESISCFVGSLKLMIVPFLWWFLVFEILSICLNWFYGYVSTGIITGISVLIFIVLYLWLRVLFYSAYLLVKE